MSITVRLWNKSELKSISECQEGFNNLATTLGNCKTFTSDMQAAYYSRNCRKFIVRFFDYFESVEVKAVDIESLKWFLSHEYNVNEISEIQEIITEYKEIYTNYCDAEQFFK